jgi:hypothetical protein
LTVVPLGTATLNLDALTLASDAKTLTIEVGIVVVHCDALNLSSATADISIVPLGTATISLDVLELESLALGVTPEEPYPFTLVLSGARAGPICYDFEGEPSDGHLQKTETIPSGEPPTPEIAP